MSSLLAGRSRVRETACSRRSTCGSGIEGIEREEYLNGRFDLSDISAAALSQ